MFENLTDKLQRAFKTLRGQGTLTEENIAEALREIRVALLEADVNLNVVRDLIEQIRVKAVGTEVLTALSPSEQVIKIVRDELITLLGKDTARFKFASQPPTVILMAGLQGSRQNHHRRQAGRLAQEGRTPAHAGLGRRVPPRRPRAAQESSPSQSKPSSTRATRRARPPARRWWSGWPRRPAARPATWAATR